VKDRNVPGGSNGKVSFGQNKLKKDHPGGSGGQSGPVKGATLTKRLRRYGRWLRRWGAAGCCVMKIER